MSKHTDLTCISMVINYWGVFSVRQLKSNSINNEQVCVLLQLCYFLWKVVWTSFQSRFCWWLWYVDTGQHLRACYLNGAIWCNFQTWWGFIKLLLLLFSTVIVQTNTLCLNRFGFVCQWRVGPFNSSLWMCLYSTQKDGKFFLVAVLKFWSFLPNEITPFDHMPTLALLWG